MGFPVQERYRFWRRVRLAPNGCWMWIGGTRSAGYGSFAVKTADGRWTQTTAHRWAYIDLVGPVPADYEVDHLCRTRGCVRWNHLEAVTVAENRRRRDTRYSPVVDRSRQPPPQIQAPAKPLPKPPNWLRTARNAAKPRTHCRNGHERAVVGWVTNGDKRTCRGCRDLTTIAKRVGGAHGTETHCPAGHEYIEANIYWRQRGTTKQRECRTCVNARNRVAHHRRAAAKRAAA